MCVQADEIVKYAGRMAPCPLSLCAWTSAMWAGSGGQRNIVNSHWLKVCYKKPFGAVIILIFHDFQDPDEIILNYQYLILNDLTHHLTHTVHCAQHPRYHNSYQKSHQFGFKNMLPNVVSKFRGLWWGHRERLKIYINWDINSVVPVLQYIDHAWMSEN